MMRADGMAELAVRPHATARLGVMCLGALGVAVAAQVSVRLPGIPVPFVLTPLAVVLVGLRARPADAVGAMVLYLVAGAVGLPVFAPGGPPGLLRLLGPTAGFLFAYPMAAWTVARLSGSGAGVGRAIVAAMTGLAVIDLVGFSTLLALAPAAWPVVQPAIGWFVVLDVAKGLLAVAMRRRPDVVNGATPFRHEA